MDFKCHRLWLVIFLHASMIDFAGLAVTVFYHLEKPPISVRNIVFFVFVFHSNLCFGV
jgi:hypothetical protein